MSCDLRYKEIFENIMNGIAVCESENNGEDFIVKDVNWAASEMLNMKSNELIGKRVTEVFPGIKDFGLFDVFKRVWDTGKPEHHPLSHYKYGRLSGWIENTVSKLPSGEIVTVFTDKTEQVSAEKYLLDNTLKLNERVKELKCLYGISVILEEYGSRLDDILQGTVDLLPSSGQYPEMTYARIIVYGREFYSKNFKKSNLRISSNIFSRGAMIGQIDIFMDEEKLDREGGDGPFLIEERKLIDVISERLGKIVERIELKKEILDISERERIRIGQDLHDGIGQDLTGISYLFRTAMDKLSRKEFPDTDEVVMMMNLIDETKTHVRMLSRGLSPVNIENDGITIAVKGLCKRAEKIFDIKCMLDCDDININDNTAATHIFYIVQESLNNAIKHGKAKNIMIAIKQVKGKVKLLIEDDGMGFQEKPSKEKGLGLELMRYRVDIIGGKFEVYEKQPTGVIVTCLLNMEKI